jgi:glycosyltransferase involved in cell wall biosynthesis
MHSIYLTNLRSCFRSRKYRIGAVIPDWVKPYHRAMASTRIRVYDVIKAFDDDKDYVLELWNPLRKYDLVIFQKKFDSGALRLASKLKSIGTKVVLDANVDYYDSTSKYVSNTQYRDIHAFTESADAVVMPTKYIESHVKKLLPSKKTFVIEESIDNYYFRFRKKDFGRARTIVWAGYAPKASEVLLISDVLQQIHTVNPFRIILICEKDPKIEINSIPIDYVRYDHARIAEQLLLGDIFIAPRDLSDSYNLGHTFTKIGTAMAVGLPVIASAVPSYLDSPAVICKDKSDWLGNLGFMIRDDAYLKQLSERGVEYAKENYSTAVIKEKYRKLFNSMLA